MLKTYAACAVNEWLERQFSNHGAYESVKYHPAVGTRAWQLFGKKLHELAWTEDVYSELGRYYHGNDDDYLWFAVQFCKEYYMGTLFSAREMKRHGPWDMPFRERPLVDFIDDFVKDLDWYILNCPVEEAL